jgi:hypothetical protein
MSFIGESINDQNDCMLVRSAITARDSAGIFQNVQANQFGYLGVSLEEPLTAFGDLRTSNLTPILQMEFPYVVNTRKLGSNLLGSGTAVIDKSRITLSTGTTTSSTAEVYTLRKAKYRPGEGIVIRYTLVFTAPVAGATQVGGLIDSEDGLAFGYNGLDFGILHRNSADALTNTWVTQDNWNIDPADGSKTLPALDFTKGNVFEISYQWLGFGAIFFYIENPETGRFIQVHRIKYANTQEYPSLSNPTLPLCLAVTNGATTNDMKICSSSMAAFTEGLIQKNPVVNAFSETVTSSATESLLMSLQSTATFGGHANHVETFLTYLTCAMSSSGNRTVTIRVRLNCAVTTPGYVNHDTSSSVLAYGAGGTLDLATDPGVVLFSVTIANNTSQVVDLGPLALVFEAEDTITITTQNNSGSGTTSVSLTVSEDQ